jgi:hypothetical protein
MSNPKIIVIHDDWTESTPIVVELKERFEDENVIFIRESQKGIEYILNYAPARKTIVLLDYNFKTGEPSGGEVFKKIRKKSSLIYVIIITKSQFKDIKTNDFVEFVNNHALAIANPGDGYTDIMKLVDVAKHQLDTRADIIIEEWINSKPMDIRDKPYLKLYDGKQYSLNQILENIRQQTDVGKEIEINILDLAISMVMQKFEQ